MSPSTQATSALPPPGVDCGPFTRELLNRVGDKWSMLIVAHLSTRTMRFNELKRAIADISQRMLTLTLRNLEKDGLVTRSMTPSIPPRVDYALTPLGHTLLEPVMALIAWAARYKKEVVAARERFELPEQDGFSPQDWRYGQGEGVSRSAPAPNCPAK